MKQQSARRWEITTWGIVLAVAVGVIAITGEPLAGLFVGAAYAVIDG